MMKKLLVISAWALLLGGCESDSGKGPDDVPPPTNPVSPELAQKIEDLNAGLVTLKELAGAMSRSAVGAVTPKAKPERSLRSATARR